MFRLAGISNRELEESLASTLWTREYQKPPIPAFYPVTDGLSRYTQVKAVHINIGQKL